MPEQPYIIIKTRIRQTTIGTERIDELIEKSSNLPDEFIETLWGDYNINMDDLDKREIIK